MSAQPSQSPATATDQPPRHDWRWTGKEMVCAPCGLSFRVALALHDQVCEPAKREAA